MANSNERGRAFEYCVRKKIIEYAKSKGLANSITSRTKARNIDEKVYFQALDTSSAANFLSGAETFVTSQEFNNWLENASQLELDRIPDNEAKQMDRTDIRLTITYADGKRKTKNLSVKNEHNALCHPRLAPLAQYCGIAKGSPTDLAYRARYEKIWNNFYKKVEGLRKGITSTTYLVENHPDFIAEHFWKPMQENAKEFLEKNANDPEHTAAYFTSLVGVTEYYVLKNKVKSIEIKHFPKIKSPASFKITYPLDGKLDTFLIEFDNGWKIAQRLHTASSRLLKADGTVFMTEKEDPICINLGELIKIEELMKF